MLVDEYRTLEEYKSAKSTNTSNTSTDLSDRDLKEFVEAIVVAALTVKWGPEKNSR